MARMLKVVGIGLAMGLVIASFGEASAKQPPSAKHFGPVSVQPGAKLKGYTIARSDLMNAPAGAQTHGTVTCPTGTKVLGGGVGVDSSDLATNLNSSYPIGTTAWGGDVNNGSASDTGFVVFAVCAKKPVGYKIVTTTVANPAGTQANSSAVCTPGAKVLGGGGLSSSLSLSLNLNTSIPASPTTWRVIQNNASGNTETITTYAICGKNVTGWKLVTGSDFANPAGAETESVAVCPGGRSVLGAGAYSSSLSTAVNINASIPSGTDEWLTFENNGDSTAAITRTVVICAKL